jgi:hypothetical protein
VKTATNKWLLIPQSCGDSDRCTACKRKPDQHATCFSQSISVCPPTIRTSRGSRVATFRESSTGLDGCTTPENAPDSTSQPGWVAHRTHIIFSLNTVIEAVCLSQAPVDGRLFGFLGLYHQHTIGTFNTCLLGPTHQSLTDTGGGYSLEGACLPHHTPRHSQSTVIHIPQGPPSLRLSNSSISL